MNVNACWSQVTSWEDFRAMVHSLDEKGKGDAFELLVKLYLKIAPDYRAMLREVWLYAEVPDAIRTRLTLPPRDKGIDLVAETVDGRYWAVQAKYRTDREGNITWEELAPFPGLMFVAGGIDFGLVCTTTDRVTEVVQGRSNIGLCTNEVWEALGADFFAQARDMLVQSLPSPRPLAPTPDRPHQSRVIEKAIRHFVTDGHDRGKTIMPCGTGKTLTSYRIAERLEARAVLVVVPSLALVRQILRAWLREAVAGGRAVAACCVCSDDSVGDEASDELAVHVHDLGVPAMTDAGQVATWLEAHRDEVRFVFCTYQSGPTLAQAARASGTMFDLAVFDEAHRTTGRKDKLFSHLLLDENLAVRKRLFMTATERQYRGDSDDIVSMDDEVLYGATIEHLSFKEALAQRPRILCDYEVVTVAVSHAEVAALVAERAVVRPDAEGWDDVDAPTLATAVAIRKAMRDRPIRHAVSFHHSVRRADEFQALNDRLTTSCVDLAKVDSFHVSGQLGVSRRARILRDFASSPRALVTNARCLTEGVDLPVIDCVVFVDPRRSVIETVQAVGRSLRPAPGKEKGYVIVPLLVPAGKTVEEVAASSSFANVIAVLRALASQDERIVEHFRSVSRGERVERPIVSMMGLDEVIAERVQLDAFVKAIELQCWERLRALAPLTLELILEWADHHHRETGRFPSVTSGAVLAAPGELWATINAYLAGGGRGLLGGTSLALLLRDHRGKPHVNDLKRFDVPTILAWADAHHERTKEWPRAASGEIPESPGDTWAKVDSALAAGTRGLPGGTSLASLLQAERQVPNPSDRPPLTEDQIVEWARAFYARRGRWPKRGDGSIDGSGAGETWESVNQALIKGRRGLPRRPSWSLPKLLAERCGVRNKQDLPPLTEEQILAWAVEHHAKTGAWPDAESGPIEGGAPGETWAHVAAALTQGLRSLPRRWTSLARFLQEMGVAQAKWLLGGPLTLDQIVAWAKAHRAEHGEWPRASSGPISGASGETWDKVDVALRKGSRGLPGGSSLHKLLVGRCQADWNRPTRSEPRSRGSKLPVAQLTEAGIVLLARRHFEETGSWPRRDSGEVIGVPGEKWANIDAALKAGGRGLPRKLTLAKLLEEACGVVAGQRGLAKPALTIEQIIEWAEAHQRRTGMWPNLGSGEVQEAPGEFWGNINTALAQGTRGLPGDDSLAKLRERVEGRKGPRRWSKRRSLTVELIRAWIRDHEARTGAMPTQSAGEVLAAPGEVWKLIDVALRDGLRGLPGGSSLAKLKASMRAA